MAPVLSFLISSGSKKKEPRYTREKTPEALKAITLQEFQNCFEQRKRRWDKCIDSQWEYCDGD